MRTIYKQKKKPSVACTKGGKISRYRIKQSITPQQTGDVDSAFGWHTFATEYLFKIPSVFNSSTDPCCKIEKKKKTGGEGKKPYLDMVQ